MTGHLRRGLCANLYIDSSNSHSFDQSEPRCLIEIDISIPVLPRFSVLNRHGFLARSYVIMKR